MNIQTITKYILIGVAASLAVVYFAAASFIHVVNKKVGVPILTTSGIVHVCPDNKIALIDRATSPEGLAIFGGHVEPKEAVEVAFARELNEELNVSEIDNLTLIAVNSTHGRDPRQHAVDVVYSCTTTQTPQAGSDAKAVTLYTVDELRTLLAQNPGAFAFDHAKVLQKYLDSTADCNPCEQKCGHGVPMRMTQ